MNVSNTHVCYMKFDFVRIFHKVLDIGTKYVTYWYQFCTCCQDLEPILHSMKCAVQEGAKQFGSTLEPTFCR